MPHHRDERSASVVRGPRPRCVGDRRRDASASTTVITKTISSPRHAYLVLAVALRRCKDVGLAAKAASARRSPVAKFTLGSGTNLFAVGAIAALTALSAGACSSDKGSPTT